MGWFGPREVTKALEEIEEVKERNKKINVSYWPAIQESGKYLDQQDLDGLQEFWASRTKEFEEEIFGLYRGRAWWIKQFGQKRNKDLVDLEFDLSKVRTMLNKTEDQLRDDPWTYGEIFQNPKLAIVRLVGNVEETGFNYLKHLAWPEKGKVTSLKEKKIAFVILGLILGEEYGFDCQSGQEDHKTKFFKECGRDHIGKIRNDGKVKRVIKTTYKHSGQFSVPEAHKGGSWRLQPKLDTSSQSTLLKMDDVQTTALLNEKCEEEGGWFTWNSWRDTTIKIRREVCDQIIRPWFGNNVSDKRLCLIEIPEHKYYLRLNTYLEVFQIPTWINKNTFWTKCSNYSI
ncbi:hypothetical protein WEN_01985 [Mycoplasma wenyonii str. Massachusetts]|uniref:Uncharacterized protein n=1 Tax=Mycoplasma wenyonii (strain Massachusetts) TaxID=1197325 RepID=I6Z6G8_MYCWM|nr:hypothetical protein [Mycoplasma wenyonii]AFN65188.1 hypothetical protein WEN_01985 [Mycoplasma wenyonii str. Massachusetts]